MIDVFHGVRVFAHGAFPNLFPTGMITIIEMGIEPRQSIVGCGLDGVDRRASNNFAARLHHARLLDCLANNLRCGGERLVRTGLHRGLSFAPRIRLWYAFQA